MTKTIIHTIDVASNNQKLGFQIKLPLDTKRITGIHVTSTGYSFVPLENEIGWLWLSVPKSQDVFFAHIVSVESEQFKTSNLESDFSPFGRGKGWIDGKKESLFHLDLAVKSPLLEGYYTNELLFKGGAYKINVYLNLEI